ncbi:MAG TPA: GGDEF domain-containing protein [Candidatus Dormibacteraeota bacterium]|nr:GGDEF domain-containing protein [Candidatus Dormibacteraeota bacterium]
MSAEVPDETDPRRALGLALGTRADDVAQVAATRVETHQWIGKPASDAYKQRRLAAHWVGTLMVARWLVSGILPDENESAWLASTGQAAAAEQMSIVNVVRGYLIWRDVTSEILVAEAHRLGSPNTVLAEALGIVRGSTDVNMMHSAKRFDANLREISRQLEREGVALRHDALHDALTALPNRTLLYDRLEVAVRGAERDDECVAVLMVDLDGFKAVNDTYGHRFGDLVLHEAAIRLSSALRESDTIARFGGDEFVVVLPGAGEDDARGTWARMLASLAAPLIIGGVELRLGASIGVAMYPLHAKDVEGLLAAADRAMYAEKHAREGQ